MPYFQIGGGGGGGAPGPAGRNGWTPVLSIQVDNDRRVQQVIDWIGGTGTKPIVGQYVSDTGFTINISEAIDIRGPAGSGTGTTMQADWNQDNTSAGDYIKNRPTVNDTVPKGNRNIAPITNIQINDMWS